MRLFLVFLSFFLCLVSAHDVAMEICKRVQPNGAVRLCITFSGPFPESTLSIDKIVIGQFPTLDFSSSLHNSSSDSGGKLCSGDLTRGKHEVQVISTDWVLGESIRGFCDVDLSPPIEMIVKCTPQTSLLPCTPLIPTVNTSYYDESNFETLMQSYSHFSQQALLDRPPRMVIYKPPTGGDLHSFLDCLSSALLFAMSVRRAFVVDFKDSKWARHVRAAGFEWKLHDVSPSNQIQGFEVSPDWFQNDGISKRERVLRISPQTLREMKFQLGLKTSVAGALANLRFRHNWFSLQRLTLAHLITPSKEIELLLRPWNLLIENFHTIFFADASAVPCAEALRKSLEAHQIPVRFLVPAGVHSALAKSQRKISIPICEHKSAECSANGLSSAEDVSIFQYFISSFSRDIVLSPSSPPSPFSLFRDFSPSGLALPIFCNPNGMGEEDPTNRPAGIPDAPKNSKIKKEKRDTDSETGDGKQETQRDEKQEKDEKFSVGEILARSKNLRAMNDVPGAFKIFEAALRQRKFIILDWVLDYHTGWSVLGRKLCVAFWERYGVIVLAATKIESLDHLNLVGKELEVMKRVSDYAPLMHEAMVAFSHKILPVAVLHALGDDLDYSADKIKSSNLTAGIIFAERTKFSKAAEKSAKSLDVIITGSNWMKNLLAENFPSPKIRQKLLYLPQGVDLSLFNPQTPRPKKFENKFVIFAGGKIEIRKGQDLIVAAFKIFSEKHSDALLVTSWQSIYPNTASDIAARNLVKSAPAWDKSARKYKLAEWLRNNNLKSEAFIALDLMSSEEISKIMCAADLAVYTSRCEAGTNLFAMQSMACGTPTVLSNNTGHVDIAGTKEMPFTLALNEQGKILSNENQTFGWGESSVREIVAKFEWAYTHREQAAKIGERGRRYMAENWSWENRAGAIVDAVMARIK